MNNMYKTWTTREGKDLLVNTMSDSHIINCIGMLSKELAECVIEDGCWNIETTQRWIGVLFGELRRRYRSKYKVTVNVEEKRTPVPRGKRATLCTDEQYTIPEEVRNYILIASSPGL